MKNTIILLFGIMILGSCSKDSTNDDINKLIGDWNLIIFKGGITGVSCEYDEGEIIWIFNDNSLTMKNNPSLIPDCSPILANNNLPYSTINNDKGLFLVVNNIEWGAITFTNDGFLLDTNQHSDSFLIDGPTYSFNKY